MELRIPGIVELAMRSIAALISVAEDGSAPSSDRIEAGRAAIETLQSLNNFISGTELWMAATRFDLPPYDDPPTHTAGIDLSAD